MLHPRPKTNIPNTKINTFFYLKNKLKTINTAIPSTASNEGKCNKEYSIFRQRSAFEMRREERQEEAISTEKRKKEKN